MRRHGAPLTEPGTFFAGQCCADCIISMSGIDLRQAHGEFVSEPVSSLQCAAISSSLRPVVLGPKMPMIRKTRTIADAINTNTPVTP